MTTLLLSILIVIGSFVLAAWLWLRLVANAEKLKELHAELERNERDLQRRMLEVENVIREKEQES